MKRKQAVRGINLLRSIEANSRISKVLLLELKRLSKKIEADLELEGAVDYSELEAAIDNVIDVADALHEGGNDILRDRPDITVPGDDQDDVILVVQCCGGK